MSDEAKFFSILIVSYFLFMGFWVWTDAAYSKPQCKEQTK
jgi:hypothetical protein